MKVSNSFKQIFQEYDKTSNKETDYFVRSLDARRFGNRRLALYIENKIIPSLRKKSYQLALLLNEEVQKNDYEKHGSGQTN